MGRGRRRPICTLAALSGLLAPAGCFSERSFPLAPEQARRLDAAPPDAGRGDLRDWLAATHARLRDLLPAHAHETLLTDDLRRSAGQPVDVLAHFGRDPRALTTLCGNLSGLAHTAQATGADSDATTPAPWPGFEDVWIPVDAQLQLAGRLGRAIRAAKTITADCVVILPGLFGDTRVRRTRDLAAALRDNGVHVLALETRGFGRTGLRYPDVPYTFGVLETHDLIAVAQWLERRPEVRRTGLIGFCWGANHALLAAWESWRGADEAAIPPRLRTRLAPAPAQPVYTAGVLAFSPVLRFEEIIADCERPWPLLENPVLHSLQGTIGNRMQWKGYSGAQTSLRRVIECEFGASAIAYDGLVQDAFDYLRWLPFENRAAPQRLERVGAPVLIVQGANDPLTSAQNVADLIGRTENRRVAALILPGGGHVGFAPYAKRYFYSLTLNFFQAPGPSDAEVVRD